MKTFSKVILTCAALLLLTAVSGKLQASTIFNLDATLNNGFTLSGTITTDGATTGALSPTDILSYDLVVTNGTTTSFSVLPPASSPIVDSITVNNVTATPTQLQLPVGGGISLMPISSLSVSWDYTVTLFGNPKIPPGIIEIITEVITIINGNNEYDFTDSFGVGQGDGKRPLSSPFVIGTTAVPEPSGFVICILAMISLWACGKKPFRCGSRVEFSQLSGLYRESSRD